MELLIFPFTCTFPFFIVTRVIIEIWSCLCGFCGSWWPVPWWSWWLACKLQWWDL